MDKPGRGGDTSPPKFADRHEAGVALAAMLSQYQRRDDVVVLALPRGGVPVAFEVARILDAPLDVFVVRKLGMPGDSEFAIGAIASGGVRVLREDVIRLHQIPRSAIDAIVQAELAELARRERDYRHGRPLIDVRGRTAILVDDGLATGSTMRAAVEAVRTYEPAQVIVAVPVGAPATCDELAKIADRTVCVRMPESFSAVGLWYKGFFANDRRGSPYAVGARRGARARPDTAAIAHVAITAAAEATSVSSRKRSFEPNSP